MSFIFTWQETANLVVLFIAGLSALALAFYVYSKGPDKRMNKDFAYLGYVAFFWCLADFLTIITKDIFWVRAAHAFGSLIPLAGFFFCCDLAERRVSIWDKIFIFSSSAFFFSISFSPWVIEKIISYQSIGFSAMYGPMFIVWVFYMSTVAPYCFSIPFRAIPKVEQKIKLQINYFILGCGIFAVWALISCVWLPAFGFSGFDMTGSSVSLLMMTIISYGIIKNQILGIKSLFFQAFISSLVIVMINIVLAFLMLAELWFFTNNNPIGAFTVATLVAITAFFVGRSFFIKTNELEKAKIKLTGLLEKSEADRQKAEEETAKTLAIITNLSDGLLILDKDNKVFIINPRAEEFLHIKVRQTVEKNICDLRDFDNVCAITNILNEAGSGPLKKEANFLDGSVMEISVIPLALEQNSFGKLIILHDITRGKVIEKMKTEFVSLAAHQLRTPLSAIKWSLGMLSDGDFGAVKKNQKEIIKRTISKNNALILLVNDLLNVAKIEEGRYVSRNERINIGEVIQSVISLYKDDAERKNISVKFKKPKEALSKIFADKEKIKLAIQNIFDNAIKYTPPGGKVSITLREENGEIECEIKDSGIGIARSDRKNMFIKFFRGVNAVKTETSGSGLGIYISKNIIEAHNGKIWFDSEVGKGTTFHIVFPV